MLPPLVTLEDQHVLREILTTKALTSHSLGAGGVGASGIEEALGTPLGGSIVVAKAWPVDASLDIIVTSTRAGGTGSASHCWQS